VQGGQDEIGSEEMAASIDDYLEIYKQACTAYAQQNYEVAATLVDQVVQNVPDDPNSHLLRGHIYYVLQQYDVAKAEYQKVLLLTDDTEIIGFANNGLESIKQYQQSSEQALATDEHQQTYSTGTFGNLLSQEPDLTDLEANGNFSSNSFDLNSVGEQQPSLDDIEELSLSSPFEMPLDSAVFNSIPDDSGSLSNDPFNLNLQPQAQDSSPSNWQEQGQLELPAFWQEDISEGNIEQSGISSNFLDDVNIVDESISFPSIDSNSPFAEIDLSTSNNWENSSDLLEEISLEISSTSLESERNILLEQQTLKASKTSLKDDVRKNKSPLETQDVLPQTASENWVRQIESEEEISDFNSSYAGIEKTEELAKPGIINNSIADDNFDFEAFESAFGSEDFISDEGTKNTVNGGSSKSNIEFLDDFDEFDDLGNIPGFEGSIPDFNLTDGEPSFGELEINSAALETSGRSRVQFTEPSVSQETSDREDELFSITGSQEAVPIFTQTDVSQLEPNVSIEQGWLAPLENAPLQKKQWLVAGSVGIVSALVVAVVSFGATNLSPPQQRESVRNTGWAMSLAAGLAGFATAGFMGSLTLKQIRRTTKDLQTQFDAVRQGNLHVQATVYSEDELGLLATGFNEMARVIFTTTNEAQRKADEQEEAKENLQRQVIRLLDDVEGAARGDLTVQAEVTADVLGAVADAFNLTIQNLRDIVQQVKVAAREVTKGATNSETFARALSSDALRQAEELAVTLNSVQVMTDSIQRVAEAAREAETVARDASTIALKGGEAVENTVAGILEIRETVAETTRKVKRLAESSQEISKIVALISQIASRTNLLALNASIEAARAGEAGRGFAIVADEVRQLADKSAKSLKEIEQIVMQIQSETGSVMTAMEEGTQQVIKGTKLAEEAKRSLENIIQVANRIDILVRSITSDTVEQTETSRAVAHVMQSVELTAQETSQEAQRVSGALQNLVGVSRDLIASVERFRVETLESR
jgi:twitching motility protein PilJ